MGRHAYLIEAHTNWHQLGKLLQLLDDAMNDIYIHLDAKSRMDETNRQMILKGAHYSHITFVKNRQVVWGDYSQIRAEVALLKAAVPLQYEYYHLISGMDLPLRSQKTIHAFFDGHSGKEFIAFSSEDWTNKTKLRIAVFWPLRSHLGRLKKWHPLSVMERALAHAQRFVGIDRTRKIAVGTGANWFSITHPFASYLCKNEALIARRFRYTFCGDEWFVQTMLLNSPFADAIYCRGPSDASAAMRCIDWRRGEPYTFRSGDFDELMASGCLFARKFDEMVDGEIIDRICEAIRSGDIERP